MFRLAIVLQTSNRPEYTELTVSSFRKHVPDRYILPFKTALLWAGDGEKDTQNELIANKHGFHTIFNGEGEAVGPFQSRKRILRMLEGINPHLILIIENDFEWVRELPWDDINTMVHEPFVGCFRLYGIYKEKNKVRPCGTHRQYPNGKRRRIRWLPVPDVKEKLQIGKAHWSGPPSIMSYSLLNTIHKHAEDDEQAMRISCTIPFLTARVMDNCCYHIGEETSRLIVDGKDMHKIKNQVRVQKVITDAKAEIDKRLAPRILSNTDSTRRPILGLPKIREQV